MGDAAAPRPPSNMVMYLPEDGVYTEDSGAMLAQEDAVLASRLYEPEEYIALIERPVYLLQRTPWPDRFTYRYASAQGKAPGEFPWRTGYTLRVFARHTPNLLHEGELRERQGNGVSGSLQLRLV